VRIEQEIPLHPIQSVDDYDRALAVLHRLLDAMGEVESHPLASLADLLSERIEAYDAVHFTMEEAAPGETLRFLMEQHGLQQGDLKDITHQSTISAILSGKRSISKGLAVRLAQRFHVSPAVFINSSLSSTSQR
jgi:HTH-type transcriptional regulator/antitoxin HigA